MSCVTHTAPVTRPTLAWLAGIALPAVFSAGLAEAQTKFSVQAIHLEDVADTRNRIVKPEEEKVFNRAHCVCDHLINVFIEIVQDLNNTDKLVVVAGNNCLDTNKDIIQGDGCEWLDNEKEISKFRDPDIQLPVGMKTLMPNGCGQEESQTVTVYVGGQRAWEVAAGQGERNYTVDGEAPDAPIKGESPKAGQDLVTVNYKKGSDDNETDVFYQLLCSRRATNGGLIPWIGADEDARHEPAYQTARLLCGKDDDTGGNADAGPDTGTDAGPDTGPDAGPDTGPDSAVDASVDSDASAEDAAVDAQADAATDAAQDASTADSGGVTDPAELLDDPRFLCSDRISGDGSKTIKGLQSGLTYQFWVVSFDEAGNASDVVSLGEGTPIPTEDLWERYKRQGGAADGSYCALGAPTPRIGPTLLLVAWLFVRFGRRRRRASAAGKGSRSER